MCDRVSHTKGMIKKEVKLSTKREGGLDWDWDRIP